VEEAGAARTAIRAIGSGFGAPPPALQPSTWNAGIQSSRNALAQPARYTRQGLQQRLLLRLLAPIRNPGGMRRRCLAGRVSRNRARELCLYRKRL